MRNEENYINSRMKRENPFRVPEGYFEQLSERIIASLPEESVQPAEQTEAVRLVPTVGKEGVATVKRIKLWFLAAACFAGLMLLGSVYFTVADQQQVQPVTASALPENYVDEAVDYAMFDNHDIYACLASDF